MSKCLTCLRTINEAPEANKDTRRCGKCWRKVRLQKKANTRGKSKDTYVQ